jgi:hypothetical protein
VSGDSQNRNIADQHRIQRASLLLRRARVYAGLVPAACTSAQEIDARWFLDNIFALELLLKCAVLISTLARSESALASDYRLLWKALTEEARHEVRLLAQSKLPRGDLGDITQCLVAYQFVFFKSREFYVRHAGSASAERVSMPSPCSDVRREISLPKVRYFPEQLTCLINGLTSFIDARLATHVRQRPTHAHSSTQRSATFRRPRVAPPHELATG